MSDAELCIHEMVPDQCTFCLHGPTPRPAPGAEHQSYCRSCEAPIIWVLTEKGKAMPIDVEPSSDGRFLKVAQDIDGKKHVRFLPKTELASNTRPLYASHFQTCPEAKDWKRK